MPTESSGGGRLYLGLLDLELSLGLDECRGVGALHPRLGHIKRFPLLLGCFPVKQH